MKTTAHLIESGPQYRLEAEVLKAPCLVALINNPEQITQAIFEILTDKYLAKQLFKAGRETACGFTWEVMVDKFERLLTKEYQKCNY